MRKFSLNMARSLLGRNVNLHLKDGAVIVNVLPKGIEHDDFLKPLLKCVPFRGKNTLKIPLRNIAWAERLNVSLILP